MSRRGPKDRVPSPSKQRRAFSPARAPGRIVHGGAEERAHQLADALRAARQDGEIAQSVTHPLHTYPARMHPATARALIPVALGDRQRDAGPPVLLDPFCGSGTTLVEGRYMGARCIGVDANPLAVLISRAKTWTVAPARRAQLERTGHRIAAGALAEGKAARRAGYEPPPLRAPPGVDPQVRDRRLQHWFAPHVRRELEHIAAQIDAIRADEAEIADVLTVVLSSILYKVSRRASDTDPTRVERRVGRGAAARLFRERIDLLVAGWNELARVSAAPAAIVHRGDARDLGALDIGAGSVHAVVTSPPYAGTYDYAEQHRLRLDFLGMSGEGFERAEMGSRRNFGGDGHARRRARRRFHRALGAALGEIARVLAPGGGAAVVLGDSIAGDRVIQADDAVRKACGEVLTITAWAWQERPKLGGREREIYADEPKREWVFLLSHP